MFRNIVRILTLALVLLFSINVASASINVRTGSSCGYEGNDICITYSGWDWTYAFINPWWARDQNIARIKQIYPTDYEQKISVIHNNGPYHDSSWSDRIFWETNGHIYIARDPDMHFSQYYITESCQLYNNCPRVD